MAAGSLRASHWSGRVQMAASAGSSTPVVKLTVVHVAGALAFATIATVRLGANAFTAIASMHTARSGHQATLLDDGRVLVTGGSDDSGAAIGRAEIFNPVTRTWADADPNVHARVEHTAAL